MSRNLFGLRLTAQGSVIDEAPLLLSDVGSEPFLDPASASYAGAVIAADAAGFGVFFSGAGQGGSDGPPGEIVGFTSVPTTGPPVQPATTVESQYSFSMAQTSLGGPSAAASDGARFVALFTQTFSLIGSFSATQVDGTFVAVSGRSVEALGSVGLGGATFPTDNGFAADAVAGGVASNGTDTLAAWIEVSAQSNMPRDTSTYLQAALVAPGEATRVRLSDATPGSGATQIATDGDGFLVVWSAARADDSTKLSEIRALRYAAGDEKGEPAGGFVVAGGSKDKVLLDVAYAGGTYLVTWLEDGVLLGARVPQDDTTATEFTIDAGPVEGAGVASNGESFLVVFEKENRNTSNVFGLFVDAQ